MKKVLFTRRLSLFEFIFSISKGLIPIIKPMIEIECRKLTDETKLLIASGNFKFYVFTSKNAVKYFLRYKFLNAKKINLADVEFVAIGKKTALKLNYFKNKIHVYNPSSQLSFELFVKHVTKGEKYLYFCNNLAAEKWIEKGNREMARCVEIYKTTMRSKKVDTSRLNHVVFMSSSAVDSFFQKNLISPTATCYAIGEPTFTSLKNHFNGTIVKPDEQSFRSIIKRLTNT